MLNYTAADKYKFGEAAALGGKNRNEVRKDGKDGGGEEGNWHFARNKRKRKVKEKRIFSSSSFEEGEGGLCIIAEL